MDFAKAVLEHNRRHESEKSDTTEVQKTNRAIYKIEEKQRKESGRTNMSIAKIETASGVTLVLNGNTVFASDDTSYWLQGAKVIGDDGHVYGHAETIRDALCLVLAKYGGLKGNSTKETKPVKAVRAW